MASIWSLSRIPWLYAAGNDSLDVTSYSRLLSTADDVLFVLASGILVLAVGSWLARSRPNPLISAPTRAHSLREDALAIAAVTYLVAALAISSIVKSLTGTTEGVIASLATGNGAQLAGAAACLYLGATRFEGGFGAFWSGIVPANRPRFAMRAVGLSIVAIVMCPLIQRATGWMILLLVPDYQFQTHPTVLALHDGSQPIVVKVAFWMGAAIVAPVAEELFFRGILQSFLVTTLRSRWLGIVVASIVFGAVHLQQPSAIPALIVLAVMIGYAYEKTGAIVWPIAIHSAFNLKTLLWDALGAAGV